MSEKTEARLDYNCRGGVAEIVLSQPRKLNAMTYGMWAGLADLVRRAEADPEVRVIAVRGAGERAFCSGADISEFAEQRSAEDRIAAYNVAVEAANAALSGAAKPTVALIRGICFGGGFGLAMCCDLRLASADARFRIPAARLGLGYGFDDVSRLVGKLGVGPVADLLFTARVAGAEDALRLSVLHALWPAERFEEEAGAYLAAIAANAPLTLAAVKRALIETVKDPAERDVAAVERLVAACFASKDYREGQAAFREKRIPRFRGE